MKRLFAQKRRKPSAMTAEGIREQHPLFQYAVNEYAQTVAAGTSNDAGELLVAPSTLPGKRSDSVRGNPPTPVDAGSERSSFEGDLPESTYEEYYGEAYIGGPLRYLYPNGYKSMRPRSCPWKLSIVVCVLFTWLSIFIVGHCADQAEEFDDDALDKSWCGSRPLYWLWVASMLVTGLSAAYCGIIGYIKVRDFAVANGRSQPVGIPDAKSDYYVSLEDGLYQADGTPQFWGSHIVRPTQAAVAVTSR